MNLAERIKSEIGAKKLQKNNEARESLFKAIESKFLNDEDVYISRVVDRTVFKDGKKIELLQFYDGCIEDLRNNGFIVKEVYVQPMEILQISWNEMLFPRLQRKYCCEVYAVSLPADK